MLTRRDLIVAGVTLTAAVAGAALAQTAAKPTLHSSVFQWADLKVHQTKVGESRPVCDAPTPALADLEIHITTLNPGQEPPPPHHHAAEELMIIRDGTLAAMQNGQTNIVGPGGIIFEASNEEHGLRNVGANPATYYVIKFAPRDLPPEK